MTVSVEEYFATRKDDRKKETRYLNVINKDSCTSCQSCATVCPVDCIYEVHSPFPGESYHQIDTSRCIGCQMCYRSPQDSNDHFTMTICPWNAIDMLHNPNVKPEETSVFMPYWKGSEDDLPWQKIEEYGYQLRLDGLVILPVGREDLTAILDWLCKPEWLFSEDGETIAIATVSTTDDEKISYVASEEGQDLLDCIFDGWHRIFMD